MAIGVCKYKHWQYNNSTPKAFLLPLDIYKVPQIPYPYHKLFFQVFFDEGGHVLLQFGGLQDLDVVGQAQVVSADALHLIDFGVTAYCVFLSHFNNLPSIEGEVFVVGDVAELVAEAVAGCVGSRRGQ